MADRSACSTARKICSTGNGLFDVLGIAIRPDAHQLDDPLMYHKLTVGV